MKSGLSSSLPKTATRNGGFLLKSGLLILTAVAVAACSKPTQWEKLDEEGFTVEMPGKVERESQTLPAAAGGGKIAMYTVTKGAESFLVSVNDATPEVANASTAAEMLGRARDGAMQNIKGKVTRERAISVNGVPGIQVAGECSVETEATFSACYFWAKPRLYQVFSIRPKDAPASEDGKKFLKSFQLTGK